ncbi:MAG: SDR family oxidoreductase [Candidatus Omnitrophica bacterium]|jgi:gluconate 5-dehydrogenase|nr:SDR family oxidoreductase [Candidatus Omnitrophota bacterium]
MTLRSFSLEHEIALIVGGASSEIGLATSLSLEEAGAQVVLAEPSASDLQKAVQRIGGRSSYEIFNAPDSNAAPDLLECAARRFGPPSIVVYIPEIFLEEENRTPPVEEFIRVFNEHVSTAFALARSAAPTMIQQKRGAILFVASMASVLPLSRSIAYSSVKTAMRGLVRTLATELSPSGVRVNGIESGFIDSPLARKAFENDAQRLQYVMNRTPMQSMGEPEDVGCAAVYLCSPAAKYITGISLPVDGGACIGF